MPPAPIGARISNGPSREPGTRAKRPDYKRLASKIGLPMGEELKNATRLGLLRLGVIPALGAYDEEMNHKPGNRHQAAKHERNDYRVHCPFTSRNSPNDNRRAT